MYPFDGTLEVFRLGLMSETIKVCSPFVRFLLSDSAIYLFVQSVDRGDIPVSRSGFPSHGIARFHGFVNVLGEMGFVISSVSTGYVSPAG